MPTRVVLDTNIFRTDRLRQSQNFRTFTKLCEAKVIELLVPEIVLRELQTFLHDDAESTARALGKHLRELAERPLPPDIAEQVSKLENSIAERVPEIGAAQVSHFDKWLSTANATSLPLEGNHALVAMQAYFAGSPPFSAVKARQDIPDAMIYQAVLQAAAAGPLTVVCNDGKLASVIDDVTGVTRFAGLAAFLSSEPIRDLIVHADATADGGIHPADGSDQAIDSGCSADEQLPEFDDAAVLASLSEYTRTEPNELSQFVAETASEEVYSTDIRSRSLPGDATSAYVSMYDALDSVEFDWDAAVYHGNRVFTVPFSGTGSFVIQYYVSKWDIGELDDRGAHYSEHNDHTVEVEEENQLHLEGTLRFRVSEAEDPMDAIEELIEELEIDSLDSAKLVADLR